MDNKRKTWNCEEKKVYNYSVTPLRDWIKNQENLFKM
jgi:hypothetical protein